MATSQLHEDYSREEHVKAGSDRGFGLVFAGFFAFVSALSWWRGHTGWHYLLPIAVAFLIVAYTYPDAALAAEPALDEVGLAAASHR